LKLEISITSLTFDTEPGMFRAVVRVGVRKVWEGTAVSVLCDPQTTAEATGTSHTEAIGSAIAQALRDPVFHKEAS